MWAYFVCKNLAFKKLKSFNQNNLAYYKRTILSLKNLSFSN